MIRLICLLAVLAPLQSDPALAEDDEDSYGSRNSARTRSGSSTKQEMQDFVAGVYGGSGGTYVITGNTIHTPDGPIVKAGNTYLTQRGTYVKVGNSYLRPESDGDGAVVRTGNSFVGGNRGGITRAGSSYVGGDQVSVVTGTTIYKNKLGEDEKPATQVGSADDLWQGGEKGNSGRTEAKTSVQSGAGWRKP